MCPFFRVQIRRRRPFTALQRLWYLELLLLGARDQSTENSMLLHARLQEPDVAGSSEGTRRILE